MVDSEDRRRATARRAAAGLLAGTLAAFTALGAEPAKPADTPNDPLEKLNRATFKFNDTFDRALARPVAKGYKAVVPETLRQGISNVLSNLHYPVVIVNDLLQGKLKDAGSDSLRFLANTTFGLGGIFDPASRLGLPVHEQDFGSTLGHWGVPAGPFLMLPFLGPSDLRDAPAKWVDLYTSGDYNLKSINDGGTVTDTPGFKYGLYGLRFIDTRTELLSTDTALNQSYDRYAVLRNAYLARRQYLVLDGNIPEENYDDPADDSAPMPPKSESTAGSSSPTPTEPNSEPKAESSPDPESAPDAEPPASPAGAAPAEAMSTPAAAAPGPDAGN